MKIIPHTLKRLDNTDNSCAFIRVASVQRVNDKGQKNKINNMHEIDKKNIKRQKVDSFQVNVLKGLIPLSP
ncbi:hypothetical protein BFC20_03830 [Brochothrix thermosphacta]|nr:hypothetical protein BFC20_03830 [Brochothrix thermosphacta]